MTLATVFAIASLLIRETVDSDTWWHAAIGRDILANLAIPFTDHFSAAAFGRHYHDSHWLFQVVVALFDHLGGMKGVGVFIVMLWSATLLCCYNSVRVWLPHGLSCLIVFIVAIASNERFTPRPDVVTCFMIVTFYSRLQLRKYVTLSEIVMLTLLQIIWSNSHGLFIIGPFMAGCCLFSSALRRLRGEVSDLAITAKLFSVLTLATLITPFGFDGWRYAMLLMKEASSNAPAIFKTIEELTPTFQLKMLSFPDFWAFFILLFVTVITTIPMLMHRQLPYSRLLIVTAMFVVAASSRRNIPLFALTAAPLIAENICRTIKKHSLSPRLKCLLALLLLIFSWLPLSGYYYQLLNYPERFGIGPQPSCFPAWLPTFLRQSRFSGQIYNHDALGGFCLYHGVLPLVDGRWEVYDERVLNKIIRAPFDNNAWEWLLATYRINGIILQNGRAETVAIILKLLNDQRFTMVHADDYFSFWLRIDKQQSG